ncbi:MAG: hypothetical protein C0619_10000 [Desulfuromonas sp.]|nr:MAG: hypothetical protein C0619_10000 [Desulfuromonas sp.]
MKKIVFLFLILSLSACSAAIRKEATIEGNVFTDELRPYTAIKFPFEISLKDKKSGSYRDDNNVALYYETYTLGTGLQNRLSVVSKQHLAVGRELTYFTTADDASIDNKLFLYKNKNGLCCVSASRENGYNLLISTVIKYSGEQHRASIQIFEKLGDNYDYSRLMGADKELVDKYLGYTENICNQVLSTETKLIDIKNQKSTNIEETFFFDENTKKIWHVVPDTPKASAETGEKICNSLKVGNGGTPRLPTLYEISSLWEQYNNNERVLYFKKKTYLTSTLVKVAGANKLPVAFSFETGFHEPSFSSNVVCISGE